MTHRVKGVVFSLAEGRSEPARGQAVPLHELARPRRAKPPTASPDLHQEVGRGQPRRRRPHHRPLQRRGR